ncbi:tetratricopeptide repeat protein [Pelolinea submarina]|nr:hypothetical protein [Pelolinea submarina]BBB49566.1 hypothetical protein Pelsub_P2797 [Pelolinea submarina]
MKTEKEPEYTTFIQQARQAFSQGKEERARELALLAIADPAQEEQAWLILASLSEPPQAMAYIENALKVNPDSQAARKAIRLVYSQMASGSRAQSQPPAALPIRPLDDTAPIPIPNDADIVNLNEEEFPLTETPQTEGEETPEEQGIEASHEAIKDAEGNLEEIPEPIAMEEAEAEEVEPPSTTINKKAFRKKLRRRTNPKAEELPQETPTPAENVSEPKSPRKKFRMIRKPIPEAEIEPIEDADSVEAVEIFEKIETGETAAAEAIQEENPSDKPVPQSVDTPPVPEAESEPEMPVETQKPVEKSEAPEEQPEEIQAAAPAPSPVSVPSEPQLEQPVEVLPPAEAESTPSQAEQQPAQTAGRELTGVKMARKVAVNKPDQDSRMVPDYAINGVDKQNNKTDPANVDTIELILISIAAILMPLLVFLYFYLTK